MGMEDKKLKIGVLSVYNGVVDRGAETFVKELSRRLSQNHDVVVFQSGVSQTEPYRVERILIDHDQSHHAKTTIFLSRLFLDYKSRQILYFSLKAFARIYRGNYDVVIPMNGGWMSFVVRIATWLSGAKMVISGQSGIGWDDRINLFTFPDAFIGLSSLACRWAKKANRFVRIEQIPNGVDTSKFKKLGTRLKLNLKGPVILCVAALEEGKRIGLAINAVSQLGEASLLVVGDGGLRERIYKMGKKKLGNRFKLIKQPYEKMPAVYRSANVLTSVSRRQYSFEMVLTEAMASNLPVVATDDPIRNEIVGDGGVLVDPEDISAYVKALKYALTSNWGSKPRNQAMKFDWDIITKKYEDLFLKLCK